MATTASYQAKSEIQNQWTLISGCCRRLKQTHAVGKRDGLLLKLLRGVELPAGGGAHDVEAGVDAGKMLVVKQQPDRTQVGPGLLHGVARLLGASPGVLEAGAP